MERQFDRKDSGTGKNRPSLGQAQRRSSKSDEVANPMRSDSGRLITTARRIGSVLGRLIAKTEKSLSPQNSNIAPRNQSRAKRSSKPPSKPGSSATVSQKSQVKAAGKSPFRSSNPARRLASRNRRRRSRVQSLAPRNARSDRG